MKTREELERELRIIEGMERGFGIAAICLFGIIFLLAFMLNGFSFR